MEIVRSISSLKQAIRGLRSLGKSVALVPTMGALHAGHISLVELGLKRADAVAVTIFVNPAQFGPNEDFNRYPRTEEEDIAMLRQAGAAIAYLPRVEEMYPENASTRVEVKGLSSILCGAFRPSLFEGVATIVTKLFMQVMPDIAIFGEKDYQQLVIIKRCAADLDIPVTILGGSIVREADGLALSSRNRYLSDSDRAKAPALFKILQQTAQKIEQSSGDWHKAIPTLLESAKIDLSAAGFSKIDYVELRDAVTLLPPKKPDAPARLLAAAHLGTTRLIDNVKAFQ